MLLGGREEQVDAILAAQRQGIFTVVVDESNDAPGRELADVAVLSKLRDVESLVEIGKRFEVDGVMAHALELPPTVSRVAAELGLPGIPPDVADRATNKALRLDVLSKAGVRTARYELASNDFVHLAAVLGRPFVVKPIDSAGARGVSMVETENELLGALKAIAEISGNEVAIAEQFLTGPEYSTEHVIHEGTVYTTGFADRNYARKLSFGVAMIEDGHSVPAQCSPEVKARVVDECERAIAALGIDFGVAKGDVIFTSSGPAILEMAARTSGGRFCSDTVPLATGVNILDFLVRVHVGLQADPKSLSPRWSRGAAQRFLFPPNGTITDVRGLQTVSERSGFVRMSVKPSLKVGGQVPVPASHADRMGYVIFEADNAKDAILRAEEAVSSILVTVDQGGIQWDR